jgi:Zn-dependent protease
MNTAAVPAAAISCPRCGTELSRTLLSCPGCHRLVHADVLKVLAARAETAAANGDVQAALVAWRSSLELLPSESRQHASVAARVEALAQQAESTSASIPEIPTSGRWKWLATLGPAGLVLWKFKFLIVVLLSKGKLLLLGLTKAGTFASMLATAGLYWTQWGIWFAIGLVLSIYIHEMGHVAALRRYGMSASAPMFIPGFGALIRLKQSPVSPRENARIGLAGPVWGLGAATVAALAGIASGSKLWFAIAQTGAWINIFNLMPVWQLDGGRAFSSLTRYDRWIAAAAMTLAWVITGDGLVMLVLLVTIARAFTGGDGVPRDRGALGLYLLATLGLAVVFHFARSAAQ